MTGNIDLSIFKTEWKRHEDNHLRGTYHVGPFAYQDFNKSSKRFIDNIVTKINDKYQTNYNSNTAFGIEDDACPDWVFIGLKNNEGEEKFFFMIECGKAGVVSCDDYYKKQEEAWGGKYDEGENAEALDRILEGFTYFTEEEEFMNEEEDANEELVIDLH